MRLSLLFSLCLPLLFGQQPAHRPSDKIEKDEIRQYLAKQNDCEPDQLYFWSTQEYDFLGKGYDQTVVVVSTCMTGTAGPDVHSVFTRDEKGDLKELNFEVPDLRKYPVLFGNPNSSYRIENGLLVDAHHDTSGRRDPLVIKYKWDQAKQSFVAVDIEAAKPYKTSYDCSKAEKEVERAICYVDTLAALDLQLASVYTSYLSGLDPASRPAAISEQRAWLAQREKDCVIYKWWRGCLEEKYTKRIAELQKKSQPAVPLAQSSPPKP